MTLQCHIRVYCTGRKTHHDNHQSPLVDGETSLRHHSHPHAGSLGTTRSSDLREMICDPTAEHEWLVTRGPGIGSHIGRRVRDGHLTGPGPNQT